MREKTKTKTVEYTVYVTNDGKEFENKSDAIKHEDKLSGKRKDCEHCNGKGKINERFETRHWNYGQSSEQVWVGDKCLKCNGKGYLEQKWV